MSSNRTLWMGNIESWMNEDYIFKLLSNLQINPIKVNIKQKENNRRGCCFLEFENSKKAEYVLRNFNGQKSDNLILRLNWVKGNQNAYEEKYIVFVGNIPRGASNTDLKNVFDNYFNTVQSAKVINDVTHQARNYGFVEFGSLQEYQRALQSSNRLSLHNSKLAINTANKKKRDDNDSYNQLSTDASTSPTQYSDMTDNNIITSTVNPPSPIETSFLDQNIYPENKPNDCCVKEWRKNIQLCLQRGFQDIITMYQNSINKQPISSQCNYYCNLYLYQKCHGYYGYSHENKSNVYYGNQQQNY